MFLVVTALIVLVFPVAGSQTDAELVPGASVVNVGPVSPTGPEGGCGHVTGAFGPENQASGDRGIVVWSSRDCLPDDFEDCP